jgi:hypothetical protein
MSNLAMGVANDGGPWTRASTLTGERRGYHVSHVITPDVYARTTLYQRQSLAQYLRFRHDPIVWREAGRDRLWWSTRAFVDIERTILRWARKYERGLRLSVSGIARLVKADRSMVRRVIESLVRRALITYTITGRGRYAIARVKVVARSIGQPYSNKVDQLTPTRDWRDVFSTDTSDFAAFREAAEARYQEQRKVSAWIAAEPEGYVVW